MPGYKGHLAGGVVAYAITLSVLKCALNPSLTTQVEWLVFTLAGALFPILMLKARAKKYPILCS